MLIEDEKEGGDDLAKLKEVLRQDKHCIDQVLTSIIKIMEDAL